MVVEKTSAIIVFDVNERRKVNETRHISSDVLANHIADFIKENKDSIVIRFSSEKVPEEVRNKMYDFLAPENIGDNVQEGHDVKSYCMFDSDMLRYYGKKEIIAENGNFETNYHIVYEETAEEAELRDTNAAFFPESSPVDGIPADNLKYVADYLAAKGIQKVYLTGYQKNVTNMMKDWGIGLMLERGIQPYLVPSLIDINLDKYSYPYLSYPNCKEWLMTKIQKERYIVWQDGIAAVKCCRMQEFDVEGKEAELNSLQGRFSKSCVYARYIRDGGLGFLREIHVRYQEDRIVGIEQVFDGPKGKVLISGNGQKKVLLEKEEDASGEYSRMATFKPGEMIDKIETKCVSDGDYLTGIKIHTTTGEEYLSEGWEQAEGTASIPFEDTKGCGMAFCLEYKVGEQGKVLLGIVKKSYNFFRIRDEKGTEAKTPTLRFTYLYQIWDGEAKEEEQQFEMVFFEGYFYLYQKGCFLRKSRYLVMSSQREDAVYKLTPELLEQTTKGMFLPFAHWGMGRGEYCWDVQENTEDLDFTGGILISFTKGGAAVMGDRGSSEATEKDPKDFCRLKCPEDIAEIVNRINQGQIAENGVCYGQMHYYLEADIEWVGEWIPIGTEEHPFDGIFNGQGHIISGISNGACDKNCQGLFGVVEKHARIENLAVKNGKIRGNDYVGGIAGKSFGVISNCIYDGEVTAMGKCAGGISGMQKGGGIAYCISIVSVKGTQMAGGLCGAGYAENESAEIFSSYTLSKVVAEECGDCIIGFVGKGFDTRLCTAIVYRVEMKEGKSYDFYMQVLGKAEEWDFGTYTVPVLKVFSKQFQLECLRAHLEELKAIE